MSVGAYLTWEWNCRSHRAYSPSFSAVLSIFGAVSFIQNLNPEAASSFSKEIDAAIQRVAPYVTAASSFSVNFIVTASICLHILRARKRMKTLLGESAPTLSDSLFAVAIIVESALPASCAAIYVLLTTVFASGGIYTSRLVWVACTVSCSALPVGMLTSMSCVD